MSSRSHQRMLSRLLFAIGASAAVSGCGAQASPSAAPSDPGEDDPQASAAGAGGGGAGEQEPVSPVQPPPQCGVGPASTFCLSAGAMRTMARYGTGQVLRDPPRTEAEVEAGFLDNGCLRHDWVASSCCNAALGPGVPNASDVCCYQSCEGVCCGRALVLGERALVSAAEQRTDWLVADATLTGLAHAARPELTGAERARLVELWQADALMEHASVASFARFSLQLLALGAPAQLVRDAQSAGAEEVCHAERAFSIASRLAGRAIGPGPLPELDTPLDLELGSVARGTLVDGCIGETLAAVVAREQARLAGDATARGALLAVAEDETRHAELAFRFVAWALARGGAALRDSLRQELEQKLARLPEPSSTAGISAATLHHYGRLTANEQRALYRQARDQILRPAFAALLGEQPARRAAAALHA